MDDGHYVAAVTICVARAEDADKAFASFPDAAIIDSRDVDGTPLGLSGLVWNICRYVQEHVPRVRLRPGQVCLLVWDAVSHSNALERAKILRGGE